MSSEDIKSWAFFQGAVFRALVVTCVIVTLHRMLHWKIEWAVVISIFGGALGQVVWKYYLLPHWAKGKTDSTEDNAST